MPPPRRNGVVDNQISDRKFKASQSSISNRSKLVCDFCKCDEVNDDFYGKLIRRRKKRSSGVITCHYYCLLFASGLSQEHNPDNSIPGVILGFTEEDIQKELNRGLKIKCKFCGKRGATIGCNIKQCKFTYHFICGIKHDTLSIFDDNFQSFCSTHRKLQDFSNLTVDDEKCSVCDEKKDKYGKVDFTVMMTPCCHRWLHRRCVQLQAIHAGEHHFKCPLCNDKDSYKHEMISYGIHVPDQDSSWERENQFADQLQRHSRCDADECLCPQGREYKDNSFQQPKWRLLLCQTCASEGTHIGCNPNLRQSRTSWICDTCQTAYRQSSLNETSISDSEENTSTSNYISTTESIYRSTSIIADMVAVHRRLLRNPNLPSNKRPCLGLIDLVEREENEENQDINNIDINNIQLIETISNSTIKVIDLDEDSEDDEEIQVI